MKRLGQSFARWLMLACASLLVCAAAASADYEQNFDSLAGSGWSVVDLSTVTGETSSWAQSDATRRGHLTAHSGDVDSFVTDISYGENPGDKFSDWLISPNFSTLSNGDVVSFYMRPGPLWLSVLDSLELRLSTGAGCSPGATPDSVGDFTTRLLTLDPSKYSGPVTNEEWISHSVRPPWSKHAAVISGLPDGVHSGCLAIRHTWPQAFWTRVAIDDFRIDEDAADPGDIAFLDNFNKGTQWENFPFALVRGRADRGSTVSLYGNATCSGVAFDTVSSDLFDWPGVRVVPDVPNAPYTISATSTDQFGAVSGCSAEGLTYLRDTLPPTTSDDVGRPGAEYPGPVKLSAVDSGYGVAKTYYTVGAIPETPTTSSAVYDPSSPPVLSPEEKISYFSVDWGYNVEAVKTSVAAPKTSEAGVVATAAKPARVRLSSGSLTHRRGRVSATLICKGAATSPPCSGSLSVAASLGDKEKSITPRSARFSLPVGSQKVVTLALSAAARKYAARKHGKTMWARVKIKSNVAESRSFRRKIRL